MDPDLQKAVTLHQSGHLSEAQSGYRRILAADPSAETRAAALELLGLIACQQGQLDQAAELIQQALAITPENAEFLMNLGEVQRRQGRFNDAAATLSRAAQLSGNNAFVQYNLAVALGSAGRGDEAIAAYRRALALTPDFPEALNNLGGLLHKRGELAEAEDCFQKAIALKPAYAEAHNNRALVLWDLNRHAEALNAFDQAIRISPGFAAAFANAGNALRRLGRRQEALEKFRRAAELNPDSAEIAGDMGLTLLETGAMVQAMEHCQRAVALAGESGDLVANVRHALAVALATAGGSENIAKAISLYDQALRLKPQMAEWAFERAALDGELIPNPPDAYVERLFNDYALRFEEHLVNHLHYRAPWHLRDIALELKGQGPWDVLDLGCGTGLCGELLRPNARLLVGVDLAPKMAELSRRRGDGKMYDRVHCAHILDALALEPEPFDLMLAGDLFIYVGALEKVIPAAAAKLRSGGLMAFSLEPYDGEGFTLRPTHRYGHSLSYIRNLASQSGLTVATARPIHLRDDVGPGWIVALQKG